MARQKKAKPNGVHRQAGDDPEAGEPLAEATAGPGHNKPPAELTDEQKQTLALQHKRAYEASLATKKAADAAFKNTCKLAKAELGDDAIDTIKDMLLVETEEGEATLKARIERQLRAARWMAAPLGAQADMFAEPDRTPAVDRARAEGKRDGMAGKTLHSPYQSGTPQYDQYIEGWHEGQKALFNIQKADDGALFDAAEGAEETQSESVPA